MTDIEEILNNILSSSSGYKAPLIYPQEQREFLQGNYPMLGKKTGEKKDTKLSKEEALITGLAAGLTAIAPLLRGRDREYPASARSTSGRSFPFQVNQLAQYPGGARSLLARYLGG